MPMTNEGSVNGAGHVPKGDEMDLVASHQRVLLGAALRTNGPMLELGVGWYSTPLLHELAETDQRPLLTLDNNEHWLEQFKASKHEGKGIDTAWHQLRLAGWWGDVPLDPGAYYTDKERAGRGQWGLVFVDNGQPCEREYLVRRLLAGFGEKSVYVFHDTEEPHAYGYHRLLPMFKYQWTDDCHRAFTTVASNSADVRGWFRPLPRVTPTKGEPT